MARSLMDTIQENGIRTPSGEKPGTEQRPSLVDSIVSGALVSLLYGVDVSPRDGDDLSRQSQALGSNRDSLYSLVADIKRTLENRGGDDQAAIVVEFGPTSDRKISTATDAVLDSLSNINNNITRSISFLAQIQDYMASLLTSRGISSDGSQTVPNIVFTFRAEGDGVNDLTRLIERLSTFNISSTSLEAISIIRDVAKAINNLSGTTIDGDQAQGRINSIIESLNNLSSLRISAPRDFNEEKVKKIVDNVNGAFTELKRMFDGDQLIALINSIKELNKKDNNSDEYGLGLVVSFINVVNSIITSANAVAQHKINRGFGRLLVGVTNELVNSINTSVSIANDGMSNIQTIESLFKSYSMFIDASLKTADMSFLKLFLLKKKIGISSKIFNEAFINLLSSMSDVVNKVITLPNLDRDRLGEALRNVNDTYSAFNSTIERINDNINLKLLLATFIKLRIARKNVQDINDITKYILKEKRINPRRLQAKLNTYIELAVGLRLVFDELRLVNDSGIGRLDKSIKNLIGVTKALDELDKVVGKKTGKNVGRFIRGFMHTISSIDEAAINNAKETTKTFAMVVGTAVAALLIVSAASLIISWKGVVSFTVGLPLFIIGVSKAAKKLSGLDIDARSMEAFNAFVISSTMAMAVGGFLMRFVQLADLTMFVAGLIAMTIGVGFAYRIISNIVNADTIKKVEAFNQMVLMSTAALVIGSYVSQYINWTSIGKFTAMLGGFTLVVSLIYLGLAKVLKEDVLKVSEQFVVLVGVSGAIMLAGALLSKLIDPVGLITFTASLGAFLFAVSGIYILLSKNMGKEAVQIGRDFMVLLVVSGAILLGAGMLMPLVNKEGLITFTITLGLFLLGVSLVYKIMGSVVDGALKHARDFTILVVVSGTLLLAGGAILEAMGPKGIAHVILFGVLLFGFVFGLTWVYKKNATNIGTAFGVAAELALLVAVSGAVLLAGGAILELMGKDGIWYTLLFGILLLGFVWGLTKIYKEYASDVAMSIPTALALGLLVAISAATLLIGGKMITDNKDMWWAVPEFAAITVLFVGAMGTIMFLLSQIKGNLVQGGLAMLAIAGITWLMGKALQEVALVARIASTDEIKDVMLMGGLVIAGITAIAAALGAILSTGVGAIILGAGAAALAAVIGFVFAISEMVRNIAATATILNNTPNIDFAKVNSLVSGMFDIAVNMVKSAPLLMMVKAKFVSSTIMDLIGSLSTVAQVVKDFADLKIPVYNGTKLERYITIGDKEFATVADNVEKIILAVVKPLVDTVMKNPDLFGGGFFSNPLVDTPAVNAAKMVGHVGRSLSKVAEGVKDLAELKIPVYKGTRLTGYIALGNETFQKVATNVESLILAVAEPIVSTIAGHAELFGGGSWFTETPAENAAKMVGKVGSSLSKVAEGVKDLAELKIPVYTGTKITGYIALGNETFQKVSDNVRQIILAVAEPIVSTIKDNPDLFKEGTFSDSPAVNAAKAVGEIGKALTPLALGVQFWSMLKVPVYEGEKIKEYITLGDDQFNQVAINIKRVIEAVGGALVSTVSGSPLIFGNVRAGLISSDAPALNAAKSILLISNSLSPIAQCLAYYASGKFPIITGYDDHGKPIIDLSTVMTEDTMKVAQDNIKSVLTAIIDVLKDVQDDFGGDWFGSGSDVERASKAVTEVANALKTMVDVVGNMSKTDFDTVNAQVNKTKANVGALLGGIIGIISMFSATKGDVSSWSSFWSGNGLDTSVAEYITTESKDLKKAIDGIVDASKELNKLYTSISSLQDTITSNKKNTDAFIRKITVNGTKEQQYAIVNSLMSITTVFSAVVDNIDKDKLSSNASNIKDIAKDVDTFTDGFGDILKSLTKAMQSTNSFVSVDRRALGNLQAVLNEYKNSMLKMVAIFNGIGSASMKDIADTTMYQDRAFNLLIRTAQNSANAGGAGYSILATGILEIAEAEAQLGQNQTFAQHAEIMERYVQTINSVKVSNLDRLNAFAISLNNLAEKLGNVDKLTHALAVQLTGVLNRLVKEIERAEKTINNADKMQVRRFDMIKKSVKDVQTIMNKKLIVEVNQGMSADASLTAGGTDFGGASNSSTTMNISGSSNSDADTSTPHSKNNKKGGSIGLTELNEALSANNDVLVRKLKGRK